MASPETVLLIPAYQPGPELERLLREVLRLDPESDLTAIVVVDDGSDAACLTVFERIAALERVSTLHHAANLGKGAALKTGFNHILLTWPDACVVTADADGQHAAADILTLARRSRQRPGVILLGSREFVSGIPARSRIGNLLTRFVFMLIGGRWLRDTQTGLRAWPAEFCRECLRIPIQGFDFELEALVRARGREIEEIPIRTIYLDGNRSSHFNPLRDSLRVYFVFVRYCGSALTAAVLDTVVFSLFYSRTGALAASQAIGRAVATAVMFWVLRSLVFRSDAALRIAFVRYVALVAFSGCVSYALIGLLREKAGLGVLAAKLTAEGLLFLWNFALQRELIFTRRPENGT